MAEHGIANDAFVYVADSAMVTEEKLAQISDSPENLFITRLPAIVVHSSAHDKPPGAGRMLRAIE